MLTRIKRLFSDRARAQIGLSLEIVKVSPWLFWSLICLDWLKPKRGLFAYDIRFFNCSLGDFIDLFVSHWASELGKELPMDIALFVPTEKPFAPFFENEGHAKLTPRLAPLYLSETVALADLCGSERTNIFYSQKDLYRFMARNYFRYNCFPTLWRLLGGSRWWHLFQPIDFGRPETWSVETGLDPGFQDRIRDIYKQWVQWFRETYIGDNRLVVYAPRLDLGYYADRNSGTDEANQILKTLLHNPKVKVVVVGTQQADIERSKMLEGCDPSRIFVTKANGFTLFQDFLLTTFADGFVGMSTGAIAPARVSETPFAYIMKHAAVGITNPDDFYDREKPKFAGGRIDQRYVYQKSALHPEFIEAVETMIQKIVDQPGLRAKARVESGNLRKDIK